MITQNRYMETQFAEPENHQEEEIGMPYLKDRPTEKTSNSFFGTLFSSDLLPKEKALTSLPYFLFLALLALIYIYNGHYADRVVRNIGKTSKELKELQYEYKTIKSEFMFRSKQSELAKAVEPFGLKELMMPPAVLRDSTTIDQK